MDEILKARLEELGLTKYAIAKQIAEKEGKPANALTTRISKTINDPKSRVFSNVEEVVKILGGEIVIRWHNVDEKVVS